MSDFLSSLNPQAAMILGVTWLVREIFGFVSKTIKELKTNSQPSNGVEVLLLKQISAKLDVNIKAITDMNVNLSLYTKQIEHISRKISKANHQTS
jgi:hypothetical protein